VSLSVERFTEQLDAAEEILGYHFQDREMLLRALTHPSAAEEDSIADSYERLEFLGDSYLGAIISECLFERYPELDEGGMTRIKITLVSGGTLSAKADELGLAACIIFGSSERGTGRRGLHSALENVFEALVAALALDGGFQIARRWVIEVLAGEISPELAAEPENPKSQLQELLQVEHITPTYELVDSHGPAHARIFTSQVMAENRILASGSGHSKKEAEVAAAQAALDEMI
jgi:ribonuclease-3